jgi:NTE family protein
LPPLLNNRALVLGGGGVTGIAWTTGLLFGLHEQGVDVLRAHRLIGTSAGATVGAQITSGVPFSDLFQRQADPARQCRELNPQPQQLQALAATLLPLMNITDGAERIRRIAEVALASETVEERERRAVIEDRLPSHRWPEQSFSVVAVDTQSYQTTLFDRHSDANLVDAVAASCAVPGIWPAVTIMGRRYMDGGVRSPDNADLATDCTVVLVLSPVGLRGNHGLEAQVATLQRNGAAVHVIEPDAASRIAIGQNPFDLQMRAPTARAGHLQGCALGKDIAAFWQ